MGFPMSKNLLKSLLKRAVANTFNAITVDSDQSTNDMVSIFSTKAIKIGQNLSLTDKTVQKFELALKKLCLNQYLLFLTYHSLFLFFNF